MKRTGSLLARRFAVSFLLLGTGPGAASLSSAYYPHASGNYWTYSSGEMQVVGRPVHFRGLKITPVNHQFGKILVRQDLLEYRADGSVWLRGFNQGGKLQWYAAPLNIYPPGPLGNGQIWLSGQVSNQVVGVTAIKNAAGTYNALVISTWASGAARAQFTYLVPGIGVVRYQTAEGGITDLVKFR